MVCTFCTTRVLWLLLFCMWPHWWNHWDAQLKASRPVMSACTSCFNVHLQLSSRETYQQWHFCLECNTLCFFKYLHSRHKDELCFESLTNRLLISQSESLAFCTRKSVFKVLRLGSHCVWCPSVDPRTHTTTTSTFALRWWRVCQAHPFIQLLIKCNHTTLPLFLPLEPFRYISSVLTRTAQK